MEQTFDGIYSGLLQRAAPRRRDASYVIEALNLAFVGGRPRSRPALRPYQGNPFVNGGTRAFLGWHSPPTGQRQCLAALNDASGTIYRVYPNGDPTALVLTSLPSSASRAAPTFCNFLSLSGGANLTYIYDGLNTNLKYDGTVLTHMGISTGPAPVLDAGFGVAGIDDTGGSINDGIRKFRISLDSGFHEGPATITGSELSVTFARGTTTQRAKFTSPTAGSIDDPQVTTWKLYGTVVDGEDYFFLAKANIGTDITIDQPDDVVAVSTVLEEFLNDAPQFPFVALVEHRGQVFGVDTSDRNIVRASNFDPDFMVPEGWPTHWTTPIAPGDGDEINALASFHEWLIVFKNRSTWKISGTWPDLQVTPLLSVDTGKNVGLGIANQRSFAQIENTLVFAARDGRYLIERFSGAQTDVRSRRISGAVDDLMAKMDFQQGSSMHFDRAHRTMFMLGHGM